MRNQSKSRVFHLRAKYWFRFIFELEISLFFICCCCCWCAIRDAVVVWLSFFLRVLCERKMNENEKRRRRNQIKLFKQKKKQIKEGNLREITAFVLTRMLTFYMMMQVCLVKYITFRLGEGPELTTIARYMLKNPFTENRLEATAALTNAMKNCHFICEMLLSAMKEKWTTIAMSTDTRALPSGVNTMRCRRFLRNFFR